MLPEARPSACLPARGARDRTDVAPTSPSPTPRRFGIGFSEEGRPIQAWRLGAASAPVRVLVVAGQHGDEGSARAVARRLLTAPWRPPRIALTLVADLNPDGSARGARENARGVDLNRDHQTLRSAEVRALHAFTRRWRPRLIIDLHSYPPRRRRLLASGLVYAHDVFVDRPTHLAVPAARRREAQRLAAGAIGALCGAGYLADRYTLVRRSGRVRHSTPDVTDARNALALRYHATTLLLEGRDAARGDGPQRTRRSADAALAALEHILAHAARLPPAGTGEPDPDEGDPFGGAGVAIRSRYRRASGPRRMLFEGADDGILRHAALPGRYTPDPHPTAWTVPPAFYAVDARASDLLDLLRRHGFDELPGSTLRAAGGRWCATRRRVVDVRPSSRSRRAPRRLELEPAAPPATLDGYRLFPTDAACGRALTVFLEAASKYALHRHPEAGITLRAGGIYPVLRIDPTPSFTRVAPSHGAPEAFGAPSPRDLPSAYPDRLC